MARAQTETPAALLGLRVVTRLHQEGMSVYMLAKRAALPLRTVQRIVAGEGKQPSVWTIAAIARVLGVSMDALAGLPEPEGAPHETPPPPTQRPRARKTAPMA